MKKRYFAVPLLCLAVAGSGGCTRHVSSTAHKSTLDSASMAMLSISIADSLRMRSDLAVTIYQPRVVLCRGDCTAVTVTAARAVVERRRDVARMGRTLVRSADSTVVRSDRQMQNIRSPESKGLGGLKWVALAAVVAACMVIRAWRGIGARR